MFRQIICITVQYQQTTVAFSALMSKRTAQPLADWAMRGMRQDVTKGAIELDTCSNVQLRGPVNILYDPASALPFTQGTITAMETNVKKKVYTWTVQARWPPQHAVP